MSQNIQIKAAKVLIESLEEELIKEAESIPLTLTCSKKDATNRYLARLIGLNDELTKAKEYLGTLMNDY